MPYTNCIDIAEDEELSKYSHVHCIFTYKVFVCVRSFVRFALAFSNFNLSVFLLFSLDANS